VLLAACAPVQWLRTYDSPPVAALRGLSTLVRHFLINPYLWTDDDYRFDADRFDM
jgi:hypothetical protein